MGGGGRIGMELRERLQAALAGRYTMEHEIGRGGMAIVFLARDLRHDRDVALKVLRPELAATLGTDRFLQEIKLAAGLAHPHILPLYDSGSADGCLYYVMPFVRGESLRDLLERERSLPLATALQITREVVDALATAHDAGIVHRDVKPENILLHAGHAVVSDFGIARAVNAAGPGGAPGAEHWTVPGTAVGTREYMSPEQAYGAPVDGRADIYGLGCTLYEMLTRRREGRRRAVITRPHRRRFARHCGECGRRSVRGRSRRSCGPSQRVPSGASRTPAYSARPSRTRSAPRAGAARGCNDSSWPDCSSYSPRPCLGRSGRGRDQTTVRRPPSIPRASPCCTSVSRPTARGCRPWPMG